MTSVREYTYRRHGCHIMPCILQAIPSSSSGSAGAVPLLLMSCGCVDIDIVDGDSQSIAAMHTAHALMISAKHKKKQASAIGVHGKGSVASVTRIKRPRAGSHQRMILLTALSSFPLSEPSLKELHTRRAPPGLGQNVRPHARPVVRNEQSPHVDVKRTFNIRAHTVFCQWHVRRCHRKLAAPAPANIQASR